MLIPGWPLRASTPWNLASDVTVQLVHRGVGPLGGYYAAANDKQGLTDAPFSEEGLKELILKVDAERVPEKVRGDKANINSDTLGTYVPMTRQSLQSIPT